MEHNYIPFLDTKNWYKEYFFWFDPSKEWAKEMYGMTANNKFDLIGNTCYRIVVDRDTSSWAMASLDQCKILLLARERWPDHHVHELDPKTRIGWRIRDAIWKFRRWFRYHIRGIKKDTMKGIIRVYGHRKRMSRDPFRWFYTACALHKRWDYIEEVTIPWYINRPNLWLWRRRLIRDKRKDYVRRLELAGALAITYNVEK